MSRAQEFQPASPQSPAAAVGRVVVGARVTSSGRTPAKVAFKEKNEEYEFDYSRPQRSDDGTSDDSLPSSSYDSDTSSDDRRNRRRSGHSTSRHRRGHEKRREGRDRERHPRNGHRHCCSSSVSGPPGLIAPQPCAPAHHTAHPCQQPLPQQQQQPYTHFQSQPPHPPPQHPALALLPPPGHALPPQHLCSSSPVGTPTKAYTSPRSAQDPPPTLLMSPYIGAGTGTPAPPCLLASGPAGFAAVPPPLPLAPGAPGSPLPPHMSQPQPGMAPRGACACMADSVQRLSLNVDTSHQFAAGPAGAMAPPGPYAHMQALPPVPALPLSLPVLQPAAVQAQQQQVAGAGLAMLYDEAMQEVVLADGVMAKELGRQGHALTPLHDAYRSKLAALQAAVNGQLLAKREALLQQHARLAARAGEVAAQRAALEREVAALADDMLCRVRSAESLKQALLGREQAEVGGQLDAIRDLLADIVAASGAGPVDFLNAYRRLADACARLVARPFTSEVAVAAADLPAEAAVYGDLASAHGALTQLLRVKDQMIEHLLRERDALQEELQQVVERTSAELAALDAQCHSYYQRLAALGQPLGDAPPPGHHSSSRGRGAQASGPGWLAHPHHPQQQQLLGGQLGSPQQPQSSASASWLREQQQLQQQQEWGAESGGSKVESGSWRERPGSGNSTRGSRGL